MKRNIILIGSMGSGKSHFGRNLAESKNWQFVDTDRVLELRFGMPIADIFTKIGGKAFRKAEMDVLKKVCMYHEAVISVGGNFPIELKTLRTFKKYSYIIGIRAAHYRIVSRVNRRVGKRPTMDYNDVAGFVNGMMQLWKPVYKKCDFVLDTTNGRTNDLMKIIEDELASQHIEFKKRRSNIGSNRNQQVRDKNHTVHTTTNEQVKKYPPKGKNNKKENVLAKQEGNNEKHSHTDQRRRLTGHECRHKSNHKKSNP